MVREMVNMNIMDTRVMRWGRVGLDIIRECERDGPGE